MIYAEYLKTDHWQSVRKQALERAGHRCTLCAGTTSLDVHHNSYFTLWHETPNDLTVLCRSCHGIHHAAVKQDFVVLDPPEPEYTETRIPRQVTEADFQQIKELWIKEQGVVLAAQAGKITEDQRAAQVAEIRDEIAFIRYEVIDG